MKVFHTNLTNAQEKELPRETKDIDGDLVTLKVRPKIQYTAVDGFGLEKHKEGFDPFFISGSPWFIERLDSLLESTNLDFFYFGDEEICNVEICVLTQEDEDSRIIENMIEFNLDDLHDYCLEYGWVDTIKFINSETGLSLKAIPVQTLFNKHRNTF